MLRSRPLGPDRRWDATWNRSLALRGARVRPPWTAECRVPRWQTVAAPSHAGQRPPAATHGDAPPETQVTGGA
ncbi:hypothetical protein Slala05_10600 [Streptomyces lavendulae subsp. lavendulae]|nr:hypothetical protein Slala05_10600 [Streptomyces lavendulae subsp. lavendulae]